MESAQRFDLPIDDERHRELRDTCWIGGPFTVGRYYLGKLTGTNEFRSNDRLVEEHMRRCAARHLPRCPWLAECRCFWEVMIIWLKHKYRQSEENERFPIERESKCERAVVALLENPGLTDDEIRQMMKTTEKQMQRWTDYNYLRAEQRRLEATGST